jgi:LmbE family N-acetylglucosaminyl deacetylase
MTNKRILVIAPHPDDETLGAGGAIAKFSSNGHEVHVLMISGHLPPLYEQKDYERTVREARKAFDILGVSDSTFLEIPSTMIGDIPHHELNKKIFKVIENIKPHIVLCPYPDRHIDHKLVFESTMVATRPVGVGKKIEMVAAYETLSETHWNAPHIEPNFTPNWVIDVTDYFGIKLKALKCYESQISEFPGPRSLEAVEALAKFRGTQSGFSFGEGMHIIRKTS